MTKPTKLLALLLVLAMTLTLLPAASLAAKLPCGHEDTAAGNHDPAECYVPGHYKCDGKTHDIIACWMGTVDIPGDPPPDDPPLNDPPPNDPPNDPPSDPPEGPPKEPPLPPVPPGRNDPEDPPIEIEVDPDLDANIELDESKMVELKKHTVWTISVRNGKDDSPDASEPEYCHHYCVLNFTATKQSGASMYGDYVVKATFRDDLKWLKYSDSLTHVDWGLDGPYDEFEFTLFSEEPRILPGDEDDDLAPVGSSNREKTSGWANNEITWRPKVSQDFIVSPEWSGSALGVGTMMGFLHDINIQVRPSGKVVITIGGELKLTQYNLVFWGTISRVIHWRAVK